ncbi:endonuclease/exonuclease/phosphatase family protein [Pseudonocardia aurantiaca]|uniref:Endonuclease/exonuclease/phosphatase family protein n=1 Tax=Pseudonocardia aurantiaca TaxID=75290 RepID=A0ABW4FQV8_9PSEU
MAPNAPPTAVTRAIRLGSAATLALVPWLWFAARDALGWLSDLGWTLLPALAAVALLAALVRRRSLPLRALAASMIVLAAVAVVLPWTPADAGRVAPGSAVRVVGANVGRAGDAATLVGLAPDVLVVSEMNDGLAAPLSVAFPYRFWDGNRPGVAVYSRLPFRVTEFTGPDLAGVRAEVAGPAGPFVLYAVHVPRPWYATEGAFQTTAPEHSRLVDVLAQRVAAERLPVVVVGDLNTPDRTGDYNRLLAGGGLVDAMRNDWTGPTSVGQWRLLFPRIDHVLVTGGWCGDNTARPALAGSDHRGVAATVGRCSEG